MDYQVKGREVVFPKLADTDLAATFDCGQCFRWMPSEDGSFRGFIGGIPCTARVTEEGLAVERTDGADDMDGFAMRARKYFARDLDYGRITGRF